MTLPPQVPGPSTGPQPGPPGAPPSAQPPGQFAPAAPPQAGDGHRPAPQPGPRPAPRPGPGASPRPAPPAAPPAGATSAPPLRTQSAPAPSQIRPQAAPPVPPAIPIPPTAQPDIDPRLPQFRRFDLPVSTTADLPGRTLDQALGVVFGVVTRPRDLAHNPDMAWINTTARQDAVAAMVAQAVAIGADAVVGMRFDGGKISDGVSEVTAYGTAVTLRI